MIDLCDPCAPGRSVVAGTGPVVAFGTGLRPAHPAPVRGGPDHDRSLPMSQGPRRHLRLESIDGVTVVSFVDSKIVTEENIQEVGDQLYSLVEDEGHKQLLLN